MVSLKEVPAKHYLQAFLLFLVMMTLAFSTRWVSGKKMLFEVLWDPTTTQLIYPGDRLEAQAFQKGKLALWNPYRGFGSLLLTPAASQFGHPLKVLSYIWGTDNGMETALLLRLVLAAFFTYMLARGIGLSHPAGLLAGNSFMFCGYFRQFVNFLDLNVVMFYPLAILFLLRFFRERKFYDFLLCVWAGYFVCAGGHPESVYYLGALTLSSALFSWLEEALLRKGNIPLKLVKALFLAAYFILLWHVTNYLFFPAMEMLAQGWTYHPQGMGKIHFDLNHMIALLTPVFDLWLRQPQMTGSNLTQFTVIPSYLGFVLGSLGLLAIVNLRKSNRMICYFLILSLFLMGIFFAIPGFNFITYFPVINRLQNFRYPQPILALAVAILAGYGFDQLKDPKARKIYLALISALGLWLIYHFFAFRHFLAKSPLFLAAGILLLAALGAMIFFYFTERLNSIFKAELKSLVFAACAIELFCYFVFVSPFYGSEAFKLDKPAFLDSAGVEPEFYRFYSPDQRIIPPDTASLYGVRDVRERVPMYLDDYYRFLAAVNKWKTESEAIDEFLEDGKFYLPLRLDRISEATQNLLFGYLAVNQRLDSKSLTDDLSPAFLLAPRSNYFARNVFDLNGKTREGFLIHPPAKIRAEKKIASSEIDFAIGFLPKPGSQSDGADFMITDDSPGKSRLLFARFLAYAQSTKHGWIEYKLKLSAPEQIGMATLPGPKGDATQDFAALADFRAPALLNDGSQYRLVSDAGPFLYKRVHAVPRFFIAWNWDLATSKEEALEIIKQKGITRDSTILVSDYSPAAMAGPGRPDISLVRDETDLIELELNLGTSSGMLVMLDAYFPGWHAFIDGKEARIFRADYIFRGVQVPAGKHRLKFVYHPVSFEIGFYLNLAWYISGIAALLFCIFRRKVSGNQA